jgi:histidinol-phosphate/aromatic aminotransferase/cobyric acid decarboxylase-like protein
MAEINAGTVTVVLPEGVELDARSGQLNTEDKRALPKARKGIGLACDQTATALEKSEGGFIVPNVTAAALRAAGKLAEDIDQIIEDLSVANEILKQGNLLADAEAYTMLRKVNQQVKAQSQFDASLKERFQAVIAYFAASPRSDKSKQG